MDFDAVSKRIAHKKTLPRRWTTILGFNTCVVQAAAQCLHILAGETKMPVGVGAGVPLLFH